MGWKRKPKLYERLIDRCEEERKRSTTPKGFVPVLVGNVGESIERVLVPVKLFNGPWMGMLLDMAEDELGDRREGVLRITALDAHLFRNVVSFISD